MKKSQGFSLIEIAIVLVVLGFLIGSLLHPLAKKVEQDKIQLTRYNLEEVRQALLGYAVLHGCLPCPAVEATGGEERTEVNINICSKPCKYSAVQEGFLPWLDLGVARYDAWGNRFRYRVIEDYTDSAKLAPDTTSSLRVKNTEIITTTGGVIENYLTVKDNAVAVIFSYGPNGTSEQPGGQDYIQDGYLENQFDDILTWLPNKNTVNYYLIAAGKKNYALEIMKANNKFTNQIMNSYLPKPP